MIVLTAAANGTPTAYDAPSLLAKEKEVSL